MRKDKIIINFNDFNLKWKIYKKLKNSTRKIEVQIWAPTKKVTKNILKCFQIG